MLAGSQIVTATQLLIQPTGALLPLTDNPAPFGTKNPDTATAEVTALYQIILGRPPTPRAWPGGSARSGRGCPMHRSCPTSSTRRRTKTA